MFSSTMKRNPWNYAATSTFLIGTALVVLRAQQETPWSRELMQALRNDGYHGAALVAGGHYVGTAKFFEDYPAADLDALVRNSSAVVTGVIDGHASLEAGQIVTDYQVEVEQPLKGDIRGGATITVRVPGGKIVFPDGTTAETRIAGLSPVQDGERYVLFLRASPQTSTMSLTTGAQSLFLLPGAKLKGQLSQHVRSEGKTAPEWKNVDRVSAKYDGFDPDEFMGDVRAAIGRNP